MPDSKQPKLEDFQKAYAVRAHEETYGKYKAELDALPPWMIKMSNCIYVILGTKREFFLLPKAVKTLYQINTNSYDQYVGFNAQVATPELDASHFITIAYEQKKQEIADWGIKKRELRNQLSNVVDACNTSGQLYKAWPKAKEYAHIFPQQQINRAQPPDVTARELDIGIAISQTTIKGIDEN
jgi:hypothetical protein